VDEAATLEPCWMVVEELNLGSARPCSGRRAGVSRAGHAVEDRGTMQRRSTRRRSFRTPRDTANPARRSRARSSPSFPSRPGCRSSRSRARRFARRTCRSILEQLESQHPPLSTPPPPSPATPTPHIACARRRSGSRRPRTTTRWASLVQLARPRLSLDLVLAPPPPFCSARRGRTVARSRSCASTSRPPRARAGFLEVEVAQVFAVIDRRERRWRGGGRERGWPLVEGLEARGSRRGVRASSLRPSDVPRARGKFEREAARRPGTRPNRAFRVDLTPRLLVRVPQTVDGGEKAGSARHRFPSPPRRLEGELHAVRDGSRDPARDELRAGPERARARSSSDLPRVGADEDAPSSSYAACRRAFGNVARAAPRASCDRVLGSPRCLSVRHFRSTSFRAKKGHRGRGGRAPPWAKTEPHGLSPHRGQSPGLRAAHSSGTTALKFPLVPPLKSSRRPQLLLLSSPSSTSLARSSPIPLVSRHRPALVPPRTLSRHRSPPPSTNSQWVSSPALPTSTPSRLRSPGRRT